MATAQPPLGTVVWLSLSSRSSSSPLRSESTPPPSVPRDMLEGWAEQTPQFVEEDPYALPDVVSEHQRDEEMVTEAQTLTPAPVEFQGPIDVQDLITILEHDVAMSSEEIVAVKEEEGAKRLRQAPADVVPNPSEGMIDVDAIQSTPNNDAPTKVEDDVTEPQGSKDTRHVQADSDIEELDSDHVPLSLLSKRKRTETESPSSKKAKGSCGPAPRMIAEVVDRRVKKEPTKEPNDETVLYQDKPTDDPCENCIDHKRQCFLPKNCKINSKCQACKTAGFRIRCGRGKPTIKDNGKDASRGPKARSKKSNAQASTSTARSAVGVKSYHLIQDSDLDSLSHAQLLKHCDEYTHLIDNNDKVIAPCKDAREKVIEAINRRFPYDVDEEEQGHHEITRKQKGKGKAKQV
ncbi:hypothetical protein SISNIDRAFT_491728 [Sistotremastrum niveocremeum HHB9708]|uniref:Uncharacterized protein n=1 Tax=Sistotremastrum niveocremeum HHB9708 TaxID=1314777 RepID=A0A164MG83_9AGAM|nr:hypothetical protein SISNIDRAFT_491728 [Sistotremastrum niveocremeum HHB9708]